MSVPARKILRGLSFVCLLSVGWLAIEPEMNAWSEAPPAAKSAMVSGLSLIHISEPTRPY